MNGYEQELNIKYVGFMLFSLLIKQEWFVLDTLFWIDVKIQVLIITILIIIIF